MQVVKMHASPNERRTRDSAKLQPYKPRTPLIRIKAFLKEIYILRTLGCIQINTHPLGLYICSPHNRAGARLLRVAGSPTFLYTRTFLGSSKGCDISLFCGAQPPPSLAVAHSTPAPPPSPPKPVLIPPDAASLPVAHRNAAPCARPLVPVALGAIPGGWVPQVECNCYPVTLHCRHNPCEDTHWQTGSWSSSGHFRGL